MFAKSYRVKSQTQMKGSDKKKFRANVKKAFFSDDVTSDAEALLDSFLPPKEDMSVSKIYTFAGDSVLVYYAGNSAVKDPLFFELDKQKTLFPTVYMLWKCPQLMDSKRRCITTSGGVVPKLQNGADLMMPGVVSDVASRGMKAFGEGKLKKGDPVFVNLVENCAAVAVGTAANDSEDLYMQAGRGKAVILLHCVGDKLWSSGSQESLPQFRPPQGLNFPPETEDGSEAEDADSDEAESQEVQEDGSDEEKDSNEEAIEDVEEVAKDAENLAIVSDDDEEEVPEDDRSPEEIMDELVENAFLQALRTTAKKIELPVLTSNFFRQYMVPASNSDIDLKKSSHKKLGKFLGKMHADKICVVKEQKKGVEVIASIDYNHEKVTSYRPVKILPKDTDESSGEKSVQRKYSPPVVTELNLVTAQVALFFKEFKVAKGTGLTSLEVREFVKEYVKREGLQNPQDPSVINLDPVLADVLLNKGENAVMTVRWDKVTSRITSKMTKGYSMDFNDGRQPQVFKGKLDPIEFLIGTRSGNKKVTLIHNLDVYGLDLGEFAHKCQVGVAASTTVHEAVNKKRSGGLPVMEVLVQGNQVAFASDLLINHYQIPRKFIRGMELAAKAKKGKK